MAHHYIILAFLLGFGSLICNAQETNIGNYQDVLSSRSLKQFVEVYSEENGLKVTYNDSLFHNKEVDSKYIGQAGSKDFSLESVLREYNLTLKEIGEYYVIKEYKSEKKIGADNLWAYKGSKVDILKKYSFRSYSLMDSTLIVNGRVTDTNNEAIPGVNIIIQGTLKGTVTDFDGKFTLKVSKKDVLVFSFVGYKKLVKPVEGNQQLDVTLESDIAQLKEVVVVGYGSRNKEDVVGSIGIVTEEELREVPVTSIDQTMQGRVAGVQVIQNSAAPGGSVSVRIRGNTSFNSNEPLYVVDGVPIYNDNSTSSSLGSSSGGGQKLNVLATLNPSDIESISVLKDAAASIYGSRAANGVVLITTKSGKNGKAKFTYDAYFGLNEIANQLEVLSPYEFVEFHNNARENDGRGVC